MVATKFPPGLRWTSDDLPRALADSLARLQRPTVDLYQHHFPTRRVDMRQLMARMADAVEAGQVRAVGVSNYSAVQLRVAHAALADRGIPLASNQVQYSLLHRRPETNGVLDTCRELGVTLIAYQPLARGDRPRGMRRLLPVFRRSKRTSVATVLTVLGEIAARHGTRPAHVALRWPVENGTVLPIPGAKNQAQAVANAEALSGTLHCDEVQALSEATMGWRL